MKKQIFILFLIAVITGVASTVLGACYYFTQMSKEIIRQEERANIENNRLFNMTDCLQKAYFDYSKSWDGNCKALGKADGCALPTDVSALWQKFLDDSKRTCSELYKK